MNCEETLDNLLDLLYGELDAPRAAVVREHLAMCDACRTEFETLSQARKALAAARGAARDAGVPPACFAGILPASGENGSMLHSDKASGAHNAGETPASRGAGILPASGEDGSTFHSDKASGAHNAGETPASRGTGVPPASGEDGSTFHSDKASGAHNAGETPASRSTGVPPVLRRRAVRLWVAGLAAAVVVAAVAAVWVLVAGPDSTNGPIGLPEVFAGPMDEIVRESVSVTILSKPADQPGFWRAPEWAGLSLVRDQRLSRSLRAGETMVTLADIPTGIVPGSVAIRPMREAAGFGVLEQNYQFDLASTSALLAKCVGQPIVLTLKDESTVGGELLSWSPDEVLLSVEGQPRTVAMEAVAALRTAKMPEGLLVKPTLVWKLTSDVAQVNLPLEVAYMTSGLEWRADYVLTLAPGMLAQIDKSGLPEILDAADLVGYATVTNRSGTTFRDAQLKLLAGDVNLVREELEEEEDLFEEEEVGYDLVLPMPCESAFEEKSFFEYHLYTLGRPTTLRDQETKQIQMVAGSGMTMKRAYVYYPAEPESVAQTRAPRVVSELTNSKSNGQGLGVPLPKGVIRLYAPDDEGVHTYVGETVIDHTPANEKLRLPWGFAFDIVCDWRETQRQIDGPEGIRTQRYSLRNAKDYDVTVTCVARVPWSTYDFRIDGPYRWRQREVSWLEFDVPLKAGETVEVECVARFNDRKSEGLTVPADDEE